MTIEELQARLRTCHARIGYEGRFSFTISQQPDAECYVTHWFRPRDGVYEDCKAIGAGTVEACLSALDRYVEQYRRQPTHDEIGRTLGILPERPSRGYKTAAE